MYVDSSITICTMMMEVWSEQSRSQFHMHTECCCHCRYAALCVAMLLLLQFVIVSCITIKGAGSTNLIPVVSFCAFKRKILFMYPLAILLRTCDLDWPTSSVITGMRGDKAGISPPRRKLPCKYMYRCVGHVSAIEKSDLHQGLSRINSRSR